MSIQTPRPLTAPCGPVRIQIDLDNKPRASDRQQGRPTAYVVDINVTGVGFRQSWAQWRMSNGATPTCAIELPAGSISVGAPFGAAHGSLYRYSLIFGAMPLTDICKASFMPSATIGFPSGVNW